MRLFAGFGQASMCFTGLDRNWAILLLQAARPDSGGFLAGFPHLVSPTHLPNP